MDYEKKYKEALEVMRQWVAPCHTKKQLDIMKESVFPELNESEDERIRKGIIEIIKAVSGPDCDVYLDEKKQEKYIAWLEKQKEQEWNRKPCLTCQEYNEGFEAGRLEGVTAGYNKAMKEMEQKEQKPVDIAPNQFDGITYGMQGYSTEKPVERDLTVFEGVLDTFLFNFAHSPIEDCEPKEYIKKYSSEILKAAYKELQSELKHDLFEAKQEGRKEGYEAGVYETEQKQKPAVTHGETYHVDTLGTQQVIAGKMPQKPAEWSEEDKRAIDRACVALRAYSNGDLPEFLPSELLGYADRLQSLRPQPHWKPSEEQMHYLCEVVDEAIRKHNLSIGGYPRAKILESLYKQLQKL